MASPRPDRGREISLRRDRRERWPCRRTLLSFSIPAFPVMKERILLDALVEGDSAHGKSTTTVGEDRLDFVAAVDDRDGAGFG